MTCDTLVNCGGQWAREFGRLAGVNVPLYSAEHFYVVTKPIPGVTPDCRSSAIPTASSITRKSRRPRDGRLRAGRQAMEPPRIPDNFEFQLLPEDWDQFQILMENAIHRTPCLETAEIRMLLNGPESFTRDGNFILAKRPKSPAISFARDSTRRASPIPAARDA
jgi:4-methylaminobutanoate oxidase (formaldehyde-forming)